MRSLYDTLGLPPDAKPEQIRARYRALSKSAHPDAGGAPEKWHALSTAFRVLDDPERRRKYDETGEIDDSPESVERSRAMSRIEASLCAVIEQVKTDAVPHDLVEVLREGMQNQLDEIRRQHDSLSETVCRLRRIAGKFQKTGDGENMLRRMLEHRAEVFEGRADNLSKQVDAIVLALDILREYSFDADTMAQVMFNRESNTVTSWQQ